MTGSCLRFGKVSFYFIIPLFLIFLSIFIFTSCPQKQQTVSESVSGKIEQKEEEMKIIDFEMTKKLIKEGAALIDNRPAHKFRKGHIKGAINFPFFTENHPTNKMTKENLQKAVGKKKTIVFYCTGALRAKHALVQAEKWGIKAKMYWYKKGFREWKTKESFTTQ